ncbi:MAG: holo-ACP synthase [Sciscionella sp.]
MSPHDPMKMIPLSDGPRIEGAPLTVRAARLLADVLGPVPHPMRVGIDICDVETLRRQLRLPSAARFLGNCFTEVELDYCAGRPERVATRWAAKEAVAKAVGTGFRGLKPNQIEIRRRGTGEPYIRPADSQAWPDDAHTWMWHVSLGHEAELAVAIAIATPANSTATVV